MSNASVIYDTETGRYVMKGARMMFPNFAGEEQDYNVAGKRNFRLQVPADLAEDLKRMGVHVRLREARDDSEEDQYLLKVGVYADADIRLMSGKVLTSVDFGNLDMIDREFRKGHIKNGDISLEFHVSKNTRVATASPYVRVDTMIIPIRKSRLLEEYEDYEDDDDLPM